MDNVSDDYYDGTKKINYGSKYNSTAEVQIAVIKQDGTDMTVKEFRDYARWLTGARIDSWMDMYVGDHLDGQPIYSFLGKVTNLEQYKYDARTAGFKLTFTSVSPWAFSGEINKYCPIGQALSIEVENGENVVVNNRESMCVYNGVLYPTSNVRSYFSVLENGVVYIDTSYYEIIDNESDDSYTYVYLDIDYTNENCTEVFIENKTLGETTIIKGIDPNERISISGKQFIVSYSVDTITGEHIPNTQKIFGNNFNFVWPRLSPGKNIFTIYGNGAGLATFTYRYPMKIGDCAIDIDVYGNGIDCGCINGGGGSGANCDYDCHVNDRELIKMLNSVLR